MTIFRTSSRFVFQVTTEEHSLLSFVCKLSLPVLSHPSLPFPYTVVTPCPSFKFIHLFLLALMNALSIIFRGNNLFFSFQTFRISPVNFMFELFSMSSYCTVCCSAVFHIFFVLLDSLFPCKFCFPMYIMWQSLHLILYITPSSSFLLCYFAFFLLLTTKRRRKKKKTD